MSKQRKPSKPALGPPPDARPIEPPLLPPPLLEKLLGRAMARGADWSDVFVERSTTTSIVLEEDRVRTAQVGSSAGVGVRAVAGAQTGYAYSDDLDEAVLARTADVAASIAQGKGSAAPRAVRRSPIPEHYRVPTPLEEIELQQKLKLAQRANATARACDPRITQVTVVWADVTRRITIATSDGTLALDRQDLCRLNVTVVIEGKGGERRTGNYGAGGREGLQQFQRVTPEAIATEAARAAVAMLGAVDVPAGPQTVVLAPGWSGILLHEAVGHGLEADFIGRRTSLFAGRVGERVASDKVTVIDDGTVAGARGSLNVDDEGQPTERKVLIERGILRGYLSDRLNAKHAGGRSTGSGRRESFRSAPLPRMTNTFLAPGDEAPEDILRGVKRGLYCRNFGGGQVDITNGNFVFEVAEAYLIEDGRLTAPVKGATLIGVGPVALQNVVAVGADASPDPGMGTCGKDGQSVPVGVGLPTVRIDGLTVGGTRVAAGKGR